MPSTTLRQSLADGRRRLEAAGIPDAALEAELLLRHALYQLPDAAVGSQHAGTPQPVAPLIDRAYLFSHLEDALEPHSASLYESLITRRLSREPTAYILGYREFYGLDFLVTPDTLIPRPETELVVQTAIDLASQRRPYPPSPRRERG
ncbi:MAG TPA: hypothetical protein VJB57_06705, partial [Dehalococcoidia bacterium]|nr:hypothetical protein [Dehalococcoidia bacterium]